MAGGAHARVLAHEKFYLHVAGRIFRDNEMGLDTGFHCCLDTVPAVLPGLVL